MINQFKPVMMLADAAEVCNGKLYILGGGWDAIAAGNPLPRYIAVILGVPWDQTNRRHVLTISLEDADGRGTLLPSPSGGFAPFEIKAEFETGRPPGVPQGARIPVPLALPIPPLPLAVGRYVWRLTVDRLGDDEWSLPFTVITGPGINRAA